MVPSTILMEESPTKVNGIVIPCMEREYCTTKDRYRLSMNMTIPASANAKAINVGCIMTVGSKRTKKVVSVKFC